MIGKRLGSHRVHAGANRFNDRRRAMAVAARARRIRAAAEGQATYHVCFDYVETKSVEVKADSVEEAVRKAWANVPRNMEVCEVWCNHKDLPDGTHVDFGGSVKRSGEKDEPYQDGTWFPVSRP